MEGKTRRRARKGVHTLRMQEGGDRIGQQATGASARFWQYLVLGAQVDESWACVQRVQVSGHPRTLDGRQVACRSRHHGHQGHHVYTERCGHGEIRARRNGGTEKWGHGEMRGEIQVRRNAEHLLTREQLMNAH